MVVNNLERLMGRRQINAMILADPFDVVFNRRVKLPAPGGGWRWSSGSTPIEPQQVTLIPFKRRMTEYLISTEIGDVADLPYVLLGRYDLDIQAKDFFDYNGDRFEVQTVDLKRDIRVAAQVDFYGAEHGS